MSGTVTAEPYAVPGRDGTTREAERACWTSQGLDCMILRVKHDGKHWGAWTGYVRIPKEHPAYCLHYDNGALGGIRIHGGLTYSDVGDGEIRAKGWWVGFDCGHLYDTSEWHRSIGIGDEHDAHEWTERDVWWETEDLAQQIAALGQFAQKKPGAAAAGIQCLRREAEKAKVKWFGDCLLQWCDRAEALLKEGEIHA